MAHLESRSGGMGGGNKTQEVWIQQAPLRIIISDKHGITIKNQPADKQQVRK
jgi:hypothetical protein